MDLTRPSAPNPYDQLPATASFEVTSESFAEGETLRDAQVHANGDASPQLTWSGAPEGTKSYAVSCFDPDAPTPAGYWHWTVVGIPAETTSLPEGAGAAGGANLPEGAFMTTTDFGTQAFAGAAPPEGDMSHRYYFAVHALDVEPDALDLDGGATCTDAAFTYLFHTIGRAVITGTYRA